MKNYNDYKKAFTKAVTSSKGPATFTFSPSRTVAQIEKHIAERSTLIPADRLTGDCVEVDAIYHQMNGVKASGEAASVEESAVMLENFIKVIALLSDEEMLMRLSDQADRKKDGHLMKNRVLYLTHTDGVFQNGDYYAIRAKCTGNDLLEISVVRDRIDEFRRITSTNGCGAFLAENQDIVTRMGL